MVSTSKTRVIALCASLLGCATPPTIDEPPGVQAEQGPQGVFVPPDSYIDDHDLRVDAANVDAKRRAVIDYLWGSRGFPTALPVLRRDIPSPLDGLTNLRRVDELRVAMDGGETNVTEHFIADHANGQLVVLALGHVCNFANTDRIAPTSDKGYGLFRTIDALLKDGYSVLGAYMPHMRPGECADLDHNELLAKPVGYGHAAKWFVEPIAVSLNYLSANATADDFPHYANFSMTGLSGGGWTTTLYAAIDPRVKTSIPIAGSVPIFLRAGVSRGDGEQLLPELYSIAGYPDLYALGSAGSDRHQVQVLIRHDGCCFGESPVQYDAHAHGPWDQAMRAVEKQVDGRLATMGKVGGTFRLEIDESPRHHTISWNTLVGTLLAELNGGTRRVATASVESVYLRERGTIWNWQSAGWIDTALPMVGTPAVVDSARGVELFYRSPTNELRHAHREGAAWKEEALGATLISDPVAVKSPIEGVVTVAGIGARYQPIVLSVPLDGGAATVKHVDVSLAWTIWQTVDTRVVGTPALVQDATAVRIYARGLDRQLHLFAAESATATFSHVSIGGPVLDFPAAIQTNDGVVRAYINDFASGRVREASLATGGEWVWNDVEWGVATNGKSPVLRGTPSVTLDGDILRVNGRTQSGLALLEYDSGEWSSKEVRLRMNSSPVAVSGTVFGTASGRSLWKYDGGVLHLLGRPD